MIASRAWTCAMVNAAFESSLDLCNTGQANIRKDEPYTQHSKAPV